MLLNFKKIYVWVLLPQIYRCINWKIHNFQAFLEKYIGKHIPNESLFKKNHVSHCYDKTLSIIKNETSDNNIWIVVDETTDINDLYMANLLVGLTCKV